MRKRELISLASEPNKCTGRLRLGTGSVILHCTEGDHEEAHRNGATFWYDDQKGAFRECDPTSRVTFEGGGMRDSQNGKPRFDLLLPESIPFERQYLTRCALLLAKGADHYEDRNWEKFNGPDALSRAKSSAFRHFMQWITGEEDEDHAAAVFFNVMAVEYIKEKMSE